MNQKLPFLPLSVEACLVAADWFRDRGHDIIADRVADICKPMRNVFMCPPGSAMITSFITHVRTTYCSRKFRFVTGSDWKAKRNSLRRSYSRSNHCSRSCYLDGDKFRNYYRSVNISRLSLRFFE